MDCFIIKSIFDAVSLHCVVLNVHSAALQTVLWTEGDPLLLQHDQPIQNARLLPFHSTIFAHIDLVDGTDMLSSY